MVTLDVRSLQHTSIYDRDPNESEESDGEGGVGNLNRLIVRPPGHSGKAKRGHLCFDASFEGGNLGRADHVTELEYDLYLRPDTCRPASRFFFNFTVENVKQDQHVILNVVNFGKWRNLFCNDMTPIVRSTSRTKWQRIPRNSIFYHRSAAHRGRHILSIAFAFDREEDVYHFATTPPYTYSRLQKYISNWQKRGGSLVSRDQLCETTQKRRVDILTVTERTPMEMPPTLTRKVELKKKRVVVVMARSHSGETPSSYVCQGLLDFLISPVERARCLRRGVIFKVVPMLNPDGVYYGNSRADYLGSDLNRSWSNPTYFSHPALVEIKKLIKRLQDDRMLQVDFIIDIHSDNSREGVFVHGNSYDDVYRFERHLVLPKVLSHKIEGWRSDYCHYNCAVDKANTSRRVFSMTLANYKPPIEEEPDTARTYEEKEKKSSQMTNPALYNTLDSFSFIVSSGGRRLTPKSQYMHYTEDAYLRIGKALGKSFCEYYKNSGVITTREPPTPSKRRKRTSKLRRRRSKHRKSYSSSPEAQSNNEIRHGPKCVLPRTISPPISTEKNNNIFAEYRPTRTLSKTAQKLRKKSNVDIRFPLISGTSIKAPILSILDLSSSIRCPNSTQKQPIVKERIELRSRSTKKTWGGICESTTPEPTSESD